MFSEPEEQERFISYYSSALSQKASDTIEAIYRNLDERIRQHAGELVLFVTNNTAPEIGGVRYMYIERWRLGVLSGGGLKLNSKLRTCEFPTYGLHVLYSDDFGRGLGLHRENIASEPVMCDIGLGLGRRLKPLSRHNAHVPHLLWETMDELEAMLGTEPETDDDVSKFHAAPLNIEVKIGNEEVMAWCVRRRFLFLEFYRAAKLLREAKIDRVSDAIETAAVNFPALENWLKKSREETKKRILELFAAIMTVTQKISNVTGAIGEGIYSSNGGLSLTVCEDADDAFFVSGSLFQNLKELKQELRKELELAVELGITDVNLLTVKQLCEEYSVKIP